MAAWADFKNPDWKKKRAAAPIRACDGRLRRFSIRRIP
jgi:hypothetical protein